MVRTINFTQTANSEIVAKLKGTGAATAYTTCFNGADFKVPDAIIKIFTLKDINSLGRDAVKKHFKKLQELKRATIILYQELDDPSPEDQLRLKTYRDLSMILQFSMLPYKDTNDAADVIHELSITIAGEFPVSTHIEEDLEDDAVRTISILPKVQKSKAPKYLKNKPLADFLTADAEYLISRGMKASSAKTVESWLSWKAPES